MFARRQAGYKELVQFACFQCRKSFKQPVLKGAGPVSERHVCPDCGHAVTEMGRNFRAPRKNDIRQWTKVDALVQAGVRFDGSYSSWTYAGRPPRLLSGVAEYLSRLRSGKKSQREADLMRGGVRVSDGEALLKRINDKRRK